MLRKLARSDDCEAIAITHHDAKYDPHNTKLRNIPYSECWKYCELFSLHIIASSPLVSSFVDLLQVQIRSFAI